MCFPPVVAGTIYYIDGSRGNDQNDGLTLQTPWLTISKANAALGAGDTVYIRGGTYLTAHGDIEPANNGSSGSYITYSRYQNEYVWMKERTAFVDGKSYIKIYGIHFEGSLSFRTTAETHHIIIDSCLFHNTQDNMWGWAFIWLGDDSEDPIGNTHHCQIINNTFQCSASGYPNNFIYIQFNCEYNLIEGNIFYNCRHAAVELQGSTHICRYNVIRNNLCWNEYNGNINVYNTGASRNLVEDNIVKYAGEQYLLGDDADKNRESPAGIQLGGPYNIIRRNVVYHNGINNLEADAYNTPDHNRIYHNTYVTNYRGLYCSSSTTITDVVVKNNIFHDHINYEISWDAQGANSHDYFTYNNIGSAVNCKYYPAGDRSVTNLQTNYPTYWNNNNQVDPQFVNEEGHDFHLQPSSSMIDAGAFLTKTKSSGSGTSLPVEDANYFTSGWGIVEGDLIQLEGQTQTAMVTNVDYINHVLTVNRALDWYPGQGVSLAYSGFSPDIGAHECAKPIYSKTEATPTSGPIPLTVSFSSRIIGDNQPFSIDWNFGDGSSSQLQNPTHTYLAPGVYNVIFKVTDSRANSESRMITIQANDPTSVLSISSDTGSPSPGSGGTSHYQSPWSSGLPREQNK